MSTTTISRPNRARADRTARPFSATCQRGHAQIGFTDRDEFESHMTGAHGARRISPGAGAILKPGQKPTPWQPPRRTAGGLAKVEEAIRDGKYVVVIPQAGGAYLERVPAGEVA
ncbi:MAG: hypothetical protein L0H78_24245 [Humibacillus sp.]|nr:hypothetical protein [Humibacillus sp.]